MNLKNSESVTGTWKKDMDHLNNEEFYDRCRTPSYAVKIIEDAIENNPITESYLLQHNLISMKSKDTAQCLSSRSGRPCSNYVWTKDSSGSRQPVPNKMHIYLVPTEIVNVNISSDHFKFGKPTRATLLKERMNWSSAMPQRARKTSSSGGSHRGYLSSTVNNGIKSRQEKPIGECCEHRLRPANDYAFMIGARYNRAHPSDTKVFTTFKQILPEDNPAKSEEILYPPYPSPPNTPLSPEPMEPLQTTRKDMIVNGEYSNTGSISSIVDNHERLAKKKTLPIRPLTQPRFHRSMNSQLSVLSAKPSVLPFVVGHNCFNSDNTNNSFANSTPKTAWSRGSLNLHFARQSKNLRNSKQGDLRKNMRAISIQGDGQSLWKNHSYENCMKCVSLSKENI